MQYPAKTLINRTGKVVEFMCGGKTEIFKVDEARTLDGFIAYHALNEVNTGLEELTEEIAQEEATRVKKVMPDYSKMKWQELVKRVGKDFRPGMMKNGAIEVLEKRWKKRNRKWLREGGEDGKK